MFAEGATLDGKYEIRGRLGTGGMGEVFLARRVHLGDEVAVKVIRTVGPDPETMRERFLRESRACAQLRHPHIVTILDFDVGADGHPYLVMEYLNGPSLAEELRARGPFDLSTVRRIVAPLGAALQLAHGRGIVHRDLKPPNIVSHRYDSGEVVYKIIDFGLVNVRAAQDTPLTVANQFLGTAAYAAPEQYGGGGVDARADVYSLGVIVYEMLAGQRPIEGDNFLAIVDRQFNTDPTPLATLRPDVPPSVADAVMRALARDRDARWPSAAAFTHAFVEDADAVETTMPRAPSPMGLLGTYELGPVIARGRLGSQVHAGRHRALGHPVAIRTFHRVAGANRQAVRDRFLNEARALQVSHPNIIHVRDFGEEGDVVYVVTDLLESISLAEVLEREGPLPPARLDGFVTQIADATAALHRRGGFICGLHPDIVRVVRDVDGERVAISSGGVCQIQDVLATLDEDALRGRSDGETELTYVAPEVLMGKPVTVRADCYTIAVLAYEMATGRTPYRAASLPALLGAMMEGSPEPLSTTRADLPARMTSAVDRALDRRPENRFADVAEFLRAWQG
jgi:serine/threonine protein kinase